MSAARTPTPWEIDSATGEIFSASDDVVVANFRHEITLGCDERGENAAFIVRACNSHDALVAALEHFASFPLEDFGYEDKRNDHPITGFNNWKLNVGHIRAIRTALAAAKEST